MTGASGDLERRFPRRFLIGAPAVAVAATVAGATGAEAAPPGTAWALGGNANVSTNGSNFLGPTSVSPLIFKTTANRRNPPRERMRIQPNGWIGIGTNSPLAAQVHVVGRGAPQGLSVDNFAAGDDGIAGVFDGGPGTGVEAYGTGRGVFAKAVGGSGTGLRAEAFANNATAVYADGTAFGVRAFSDDVGVSATGEQDGVTGHANPGSTGGFGVTGTGERGVSGFGSSVGVSAIGDRGLYASTNGAGEAGFFSGRVTVQGNLSKSGGSFEIDHPLDPDNRWLRHSFVESPDMMNVYNGNATTDADGHATVDLPDYFETLNRDFRYQLTVIGDFAQAVVARTVQRGSFDIRTDRPRVRVSWQVTGVRQDDWARHHRVVVDERKAPKDRGTRAFAAPGSGARAMDHGPGSEASHRDLPRMVQRPVAP